jgi:hypothetical protein
MGVKKFFSLIVVLVISSLAMADNGKITIAGATQFDWFFSYKSNFPAATNDYIDVDGDGNSILLNGQLQQLAATYTGNQTTQQLLAQGPWIVNYRGTGSGNGLEELIAYYNSSPYINQLTSAIEGAVNRWTYYFSSDYPFPPLDRIDIASMDVPTTQFISVGSQDNAQPFSKPFMDGYGLSHITPWDANTTNQLADLKGLNVNTAEPNDKTIFDFPIGWYPFCFLSSRATGLKNVTVADLQCLYLTGRSLNGVNYNVATRDSGSGTRNATMSSIGVDPSWGRGDNVGKKGKDPNQQILGKAFRYNNTDSSGVMANNQRNNRFMVSYQNLYSSNGTPLINSGAYECLNVSFDGGKTFIRPEDLVNPAEIPANIRNQIDQYGSQPLWQSNVFWPTVSNGWKIGGSETFSTVGDPYATELAAHLKKYQTAKHPYGMRNPDAAAYVINIIESVKAVENLGPSPATAGSPGQALAYKSILVAGVYGLPNPSNPTEFLVDPNLYNPRLTGLPINTAGLTPYGTHGYGLLPNRDTNGDGVVNAYDAPYLALNGNIIKWDPFDSKYALQGDINHNGTWDINDLRLAVLICEKGSAAPVDTSVCYDILCDFDGNGWFDANDVRFMADGVVLSGFSSSDTTNVVCREKNFTLVDDSSVTGNFFGTVKAHGTYKHGDSRADIAMLKDSKVYAQAGAAPVADRVIDQTDISYMQKVLDGRLLNDTYIYQVPLSGLSWKNPIDRIFVDFSCDLNNDMVINREDLRILIEDILDTELGDFDLNSIVDIADRQTIVNNMGKAGTYINGDINGDGFVDQNDLDIFDAIFGLM